MRKYFLLSAVALMLTTTANATTDYAEVTAKATIEVASEITCDELDWGTIVVKANNPEFTLSTDTIAGDAEDMPSIISVSGYSLDGKCYKDGVIFDSYGPDDIIPMTFSTTSTTLKNANGDELGLALSWEADHIYSTLTIPANVKAGEYTSSFTATFIY
ncbi:MAG: hypothetical protein IJF12_00400 [Alphaproteobacteria bacterium]|nr:hypothetical protein [Alphaproteobacteria bacterium]